MPDLRTNTDESGTMTQAPTLLETQIDSIALQLWRMKSRVESDDLLDHLTESERDKLSAALSRAEENLHRLTESLRDS
jgi:hypothetical protein